MNSNDTGSDRDYQKIQVECYCGYKANERPVAFTALGRRWEISEIVDRWYEGGMKPDEAIINYFKVKTKDRSFFILKYVAESDVWSIRLHPYEKER